MSVWSLSYSACQAHAPYCTVTCDLFGSAVFSHINSQTARLSGKSYWK